MRLFVLNCVLTNVSKIFTVYFFIKIVSVKTIFLVSYHNDDY